MEHKPQREPSVSERGIATGALPQGQSSEVVATGTRRPRPANPRSETFASNQQSSPDIAQALEWAQQEIDHPGSGERYETMAAALLSLFEQLEAAQRDNGRLALEAATADQDWKRAENEVSKLRHALTQVRAECDLPDYIAEFIGEALGSSEEARDVRA